ncbi:hypothetical protein IFR05_002491 [Cadophora sp. M221]|nr:hypothetical protein IFR05_002491 [Cadophora sp. M221]
MCKIRQHCSICNTNFDRVPDYCPVECPEHADATSDALREDLEKDGDWCQAIGIVCNKCSRKEGNEEPSRLVSEMREAGALKRTLRSQLLVKKREAEDERLAWARAMKLKKEAEAEQAKALRLEKWLEETAV